MERRYSAHRSYVWIRDYRHRSSYDGNQYTSQYPQRRVWLYELARLIFAYDKTLSVLRFAEQNAEEISAEEMIQFKRKDFMHLSPPVPDGMIVTNPPYDERIKVDDNEAFYKAIGDRFKQEFQGYTAWLISSNMSAIKRIGLRPSRKIALYNGKLECKFLKYDLYSGSKKAKYANQD